MTEAPTVIPAGKLKRIHVNRQRIARNRKRPDREPVLTCKAAGVNAYGYSITIDGPSRLVYRPDKPLACGAVAWIETRAAVTVE